MPPSSWYGLAFSLSANDSFARAGCENVVAERMAADGSSLLWSLLVAILPPTHNPPTQSKQYLNGPMSAQ
jgi:hypothetical protein